MGLCKRCLEEGETTPKINNIAGTVEIGDTCDRCGIRNYD